MSLVRPSLDYTSKDFDALRARLFNVIESAFPEWTDQQVANFGNILVELQAFVGDVLGFYQDNQARESRWTTAQLRRTMLGLVKLIGYTPAGASAATAALTVQLDGPPAGSVTIDLGDQFRTLEITDPLVFQAITSATILAGQDPPAVIVTVEHSEPREEIVQSTDLPDQEYPLGDTPFLDGSLIITAGDGGYTVVSDFLSSTSVDKHVTVTVDENDRAHVRFGDGALGSIPSGAISFRYKVGGGSRGNVEPNSIRRAAKSYTDSLGNSVNVSVSNVSKAGGGLERQSVEAIRESAPRSVRTQTRTVSREDYEINALRVPGVARALMLSSDEKPSVLENTGELYVVPAGAGVASNALLNAVLTMCKTTYPKTLTFRLRVRSAKYLPINISARVHLVKGTPPAVVGPALRANIAAFFALVAKDGSQNPNVDFGYYLEEALAYSDIYNTIRDTAGVRKIDDAFSAVTVNGSVSDVELTPEQFPILGTVTLVDAFTGFALP